MSEIGSGNNSSYPGALDTNTQPEVNSPAAGKTKARKEPIEDLTDAVIKIETELGTDPAGSLADVKTFLQTHHQTNGTHKTTHGPHVWIDAADYNTLTDAANAAIGKTLVISSSINLTLAEATGGAVVIPATVLGVFPMAPGVINKNTATSFTCNAPVVGNPMHQWLSGFAAGDVTFGTVGTTQIGFCSPVWWGLPGTQSVNSIALACAISSGINVKLPPGTFGYDTGLVITYSIVFKGSGGLPSSPGMNNFTKLSYSGTGIAISLTSAHQNKQLLDFALIGNENAEGGIYVGSDGYGNTNILRKLYISGFTKINKYGLRVKGFYNTFEHVECTGNYWGLLANEDSFNANEFRNCKFRSSVSYGANISYALNVSFYTCSFEGNGYEGTYISSANVDNLNFYSCYWESNNTTGGLGEIQINGASTADRASRVNFYNPEIQRASSPPALMVFGNAEYCTIFNPHSTGGTINVSSDTLNCQVIGANLPAVTGNHSSGMYIQDIGGGLSILTVNSTTPSVAAQIPTYVTANTVSTTYTNFTGGVEGQTFRMLINDANTIIDFTNDATPTNLRGNVGANWTPSNGDWMECVFDGTNWRCSIHDVTA